MAKKLRLIPSGPPSDPAACPPGLGAHGQALWREVMSQYDVVDVAGRNFLTQACAALDRAEECKRIIDEQGAVVVTRVGSKEHPLLKAELANRSFVVRTLQRLGLNFEPLHPVTGRPPQPFGWTGSKE